jgi:hypothetical protein
LREWEIGVTQPAIVQSLSRQYQNSNIISLKEFSMVRSGRWLLFLLLTLIGAVACATSGAPEVDVAVVVPTTAAMATPTAAATFAPVADPTDMARLYAAPDIARIGAGDRPQFVNFYANW